MICISGMYVSFWDEVVAAQVVPVLLDLRILVQQCGHFLVHTLCVCVEGVPV
jgi:hypothetical protein